MRQPISASWSVVSLLMLTLHPARIEAQSRAPSAAENSLKKYLQEYVREPGSDDFKTTKYFDALVDLNGDGIDDAIAHLMGNGWCGSGGCITLILARDGSSWRIVTKLTITRAPIKVLASSSNGWHDLSVVVRGGGILQSYQAQLGFDGRSYPSNPSVPPALRLDSEAPGRVV